MAVASGLDGPALGEEGPRVEACCQHGKGPNGSSKGIPCALEGSGGPPIIDGPKPGRLVDMVKRTRRRSGQSKLRRADRETAREEMTSIEAIVARKSHEVVVAHGYVGRGVDGEADSNDGAKLAALRPDAYRRQRGNEQGIGAATAKTLLGLWEKVPESTRVEIFPELAAAAAAARLLSSKGLPEGMEFDEAQDLTLTEFWMLLELLRACRKRTGKSPWLLIAGDAGQRVEASGFEWGRYTELLSSRWRKAATFDLHEHVRFPSRIAAVVNRSSIFYSLVDKNRRPEKQQPAVESEHVTGHALYVRVDRTEQANGLVEQLAALEGTAVITAADETARMAGREAPQAGADAGRGQGSGVPAGVRAGCGSGYRGLRRERDRRQDAAAAGEPANGHRPAAGGAEPGYRDAGGCQRRTGREPGPEHAGAGRRSRPLQPGRHHRPVRRRDGRRPKRRTSERIRRAEAIVEEDPDRAWEIASQTVAEMGAPDVPNGVSDREVRRDARATLLRTLALLLGRRRGQGRQRASEAVAATRRGYGR